MERLSPGSPCRGAPTRRRRPGPSRRASRPPHQAALRRPRPRVASWEAPDRRPIPAAEVKLRRLSARWVVPVESPPLTNGAVLIGADGRIAAVGPDATVPRPSDALVEDFGDALLLP